MPRKPETVDTLSLEVEPLYDNLNEGSDLAVALIGAAYLDQCLGSLLKQKFIDSSISEKLLEPGSGLLGEFTARARLAYSLGLIEKPIYVDLITIVEIRNIFAHSHLTISFKDEIVADKCNTLHFAQGLYDSWKEIRGKGTPDTPRIRFCVTVADISLRLLLEALKLKGKKH